MTIPCEKDIDLRIVSLEAAIRGRAALNFLGSTKLFWAHSALSCSDFQVSQLFG